MGNRYSRGVTVGYSSTGTLLWEALSTLPTRAALLHNGDVCATGGYDALITCFAVEGTTPIAVITATPLTGVAPLTVDFSAQASTPASAPLASWAWTLGDGATASGVEVAHVYTTPGTYNVRLDVSDTLGAIGTAFLPIVVTAVTPLDGDADGVTSATDCDDENSAIYPGAPEICDGIDNDCDAVVDPDLSQACCGSGVSFCTAGAWGACSTSCIDGGISNADDNNDPPEPSTGCSCSGSRNGSPSLLGILGIAPLLRMRRRR